MRLRLYILAACAIGVALVVMMLFFPGSEERSVRSTGMVANVDTATVEIGEEEAGRVVYFSVLAGGTEDSGLTVNDSVDGLTLIAADNYVKRAVQVYRATGLAGDSTRIAYAQGTDSQHLAAFKVIGYQPVSGDPWVTKRRPANDSLSQTLTLTVPAEGAVLLHGKKYNVLSDTPPGTVIDEAVAGGGARGYWINDTGAEATVSFTFETTVSTNEKYAAALILEKAAPSEVSSLSPAPAPTPDPPVRGATGLNDPARATAQACRDLSDTWRRDKTVARSMSVSGVQRPVVDLSRSGVVPGGDIRQPLQDAFDAAAGLASPLLFLPPTTGPQPYSRSGRVTLEAPGAVLCAYGARLAATDVQDLGIGMAGDGTSIYGLTMEAPPGAFSEWVEDWEASGGTRPPIKFPDGDGEDYGAWASHVVVLGARDVILRDLTLQGAMRGGIRLYQASNVLIEGACIYRTHSDGIHIANGSEGVTVRGNTVIESGDDCISIVTYDRDEQPRTVRDVLFQDNVCKGSRTRGLTVIGGEDVDIVENEVRDTLMAGILLYPSPSHNTFPVRNVTVARNRLDGAGLRGTECDNCGDIVVNDPGNMIENVTIEENDISPRDPGAPIRTGAICAATLL